MQALTLCSLLALGLGLLLVATGTSATEVQVCGVEAAKRQAAATAQEEEADLKDTEHVSISSCSKPPCRLKRKTTTIVEMKFTPDKKVTSLKTEVHAKILGIPFPFIGVDNTNACGNIFLADASTKARCPLAAGQEYIYRNKFDILEIYPKVKVNVHWALVSQDNERILCFNVPAKIVS